MLFPNMTFKGFKMSIVDETLSKLSEIYINNRNEFENTIVSIYDEEKEYQYISQNKEDIKREPKKYQIHHIGLSQIFQLRKKLYYYLR